MIKWFKRNQHTPDPQKTADTELMTPATDLQQAPEEKQPKQTLFTRFKQGLSKTRHQLGDGIGRLLLGKKEIDAFLLEELETILLSADIGIETTKNIVQQLSDGLARKQLADGEAVFAALKTQLQTILTGEKQPFALDMATHRPFVILMVGVNGAGKTTTIGKLAKQYQAMGKKVMLAAGDTFRAAAIEQLQAWGERNQITVIAQHTGADSASVIYDALQAAKARNVDVLLADTAGRLHTQQNLMEELKKVKRVMQKLDPTAPHETMLVLDASIGQNALNQARQFHEAVGVTGITMTKLDGTAKGGILFAIANELEIPFRYIGVGEGIDDLRPFSASQFVDAIFNDDHI
ncbi:signal recognition particle-docking protein FtsY [Legionella septentrionalis]|nr:signal recognition particle-docking protein FtsY [Legionella septentrionalis]RUR09341.1 signal recognition particle-docking protein FtsY [Legionella septentrionalis]RUR14291.1 signal recognition particle-docking protein FtsY [Legionella septentrionalis]